MTPSHSWSRYGSIVRFYNAKDMRLTSIFNVFSKRPECSAKSTHEIPPTTRNRVILWCKDLFGVIHHVGGYRSDCYADFWTKIHQRLLMRTGRLQLSPTDGHGDPTEALNYLLNCPGEEFLDFLEDIFRVDTFSTVGCDESLSVKQLNILLSQDKLPYFVTPFELEEIEDGKYRQIYPKIISKDSEILHANAILPTLNLLQRPHFRVANAEFLAALEDYRAGKYGDSLTKCGSAFESVLKVICRRKNWPYQETDTAGPLIKVVLKHTSLEGYFDPLLAIVATLRNRLSTSHGGGTAPKQPARHLVLYALNATASAILLLTQETNEF